MLHVPENVRSEPKIGNPVNTAVVAKGGGSAVLALTKCGAAVTGCGIKGQEFPGGGEGAAAKLGEGRPSWEGRQPWQWAVLQAACKHPFCSAASNTAQGAQNSTAVASSSSGATMQPSVFLWCTLSQQSVPFLWNGCVCGVFLLMNGDTFSLLGRGDSGTTQNHNTNSYCPELEGGDWQSSSLAARTTRCTLDARLPWTKSSAGWTGLIFFPYFFLSFALLQWELHRETCAMTKPAPNTLPITRLIKSPKISEETLTEMNFGSGSFQTFRYLTSNLSLRCL